MRPWVLLSQEELLTGQNAFSKGDLKDVCSLAINLRWILPSVALECFGVFFKVWMSRNTCGAYFVGCVESMASCSNTCKLAAMGQLEQHTFFKFFIFLIAFQEFPFALHICSRVQNGNLFVCGFRCFRSKPADFMKQTLFVTCRLYSWQFKPLILMLGRASPPA